MESNYTEIITCLGCNKQFNLEDRKPLTLPCGDQICSQCYKTQTDQVQNQQIQCPSDASHLYGIDHPVIESKLMISLLQKIVYERINCKEHKENQVQFYCQNQNTIICFLCFAIESHQKCFQERIQHFAFERKFLDESFEKITPTLQEQINEIQILITGIQAFIQKKRNFNTDEIESMIVRICSILQISAFDDKIKKNLKLSSSIINFITNFSETFKSIKNTNNEEHKQDLVVLTQEEIKIIELEKQVTGLQNQLREVSDQLELLSKVHKEEITSMAQENKNRLDSQAETINQLQQSNAKLESQSNDLQIKLENSLKDNQTKLDQVSKENKNTVEVLQSEHQVKFDQQLKEITKFKTYAKELEEQMELLKNQITKLQNLTNLGSLVENILDINFQPKLFQLPGTTKLIFRATRDGFKAIDFHNKCDNQGPTISFIKSEHGQIFGAYTSVSWASGYKWNKDNDAFVFSLTKNTLHKQYQNFDNAVAHNKDYLMIFGGGCDIRIDNDCNNNNTSYSNLGRTYMPPEGYKEGDQFSKDYLGGSYQFKVIEIEVYQVTI